MSWECGDDWLIQLWSIDDKLAFLNNGSYGAVPKQVQRHRALIQQEIERNPVNFLARELPAKLTEQRVLLSSWLNVDSDSIAFVQNATSGMSAILRSLKFSAGDEILFHDHGYRWIWQALENLSFQTGVVIKTAKLPWPALSAAQLLESFEREISQKTKLVICDHISSPSGLVFPVAEMISLAQSKGVTILIDGAHAPGALDLNLGSLKPDLYVGNLHKWACAPRGTAFIHVSQAFREVIRPECLSYCGGRGHFLSSSNLSDFFDWNGTVDFSAWLSTSEALSFNETLGWSQLFSNRKKLLNRVKKIFLQELKGLVVPEIPDEMSGPMWAFQWPLARGLIPSAEIAFQIARDLYQRDQIEVPVFYFKDGIYIRVSAQAFNKLNDYERLLKAVLSHRLSATRKRVR